jgi:hypothetical protein
MLRPSLSGMVSASILRVAGGAPDNRYRERVVRMTHLKLISDRHIVRETYVRSGQGYRGPDLFAPQPNLTGRTYAKLWSYMSIAITAAVWQLEIPSSEKLVLLALADHAKDDGFCWPGIPGLAKKCSLSERQVQRYIKSLEKKGFLKLTYRHAKSTYFKVVVTSTSPSKSRVTPATPHSDTSVTTDGDTHVTQNRKLNRKESSTKEPLSEWKKRMGIYVP